MRAAVSVVAAVLSLVGCSRSSSSASPTASPAAIASQAAASPGVGSIPLAVAPSSSVPVSASDEVDRTAAFFRGFSDNSEFAFLRESLAPRVTQFIALKDIAVNAAIRASRIFFKDKTGISYVPDMASLRTEKTPLGALVHVPVEMRWSRKADPTQFGLAADANVLGEPLHIDRDVTVDVDLQFDATGHITSYIERHTRTPILRVMALSVAGEGCETDLPKGSLVQDLGERVITEQISTGPARTLAHVHAKDQDVWMLSQRHFWKTSSHDTAWLECLVPVGDAGK